MKQPKRTTTASQPERREQLLAEIVRLADGAIYGSVSETFRTCGNPGCRCHGEGPKHGPHLYVSYRGPAGKTTSYYVPAVAHEAIRDGVTAWHDLQGALRELADLNREAALRRAKLS